MKRCIVALSIGALAHSCRFEHPRLAAKLTLYVAPTGNDAWSGRLPAASANDGPLATLEGARDAIRELKRSGGIPYGGVDVYVHPGVYVLDRAFVLTTEDSGTAAAPIRYIAANGGETRLIGGRFVDALQPVSDDAVRARLPPAARDHVVQADLRTFGIRELGSAGGGGIELFYGMQPMTLARWPNAGFDHIADVLGDRPVEVRGIRGDRSGALLYEGDRPRRWLAEPDVWLHGFWFWDWSDERKRVASIDPVKRIIRLAEPQHHYGYRKGQWFYAYNLLAELDTPGEWYVDRDAGILYFWPPDTNQRETLVSVLNTLVEIDGASHVTFAGFSFEAARDTAIIVRGGARVRIAACMIRNIGGWAMILRGGAGHEVDDCTITETGQGGIMVEGGDRASLTASQHAITHNHIYRFSRWVRTRQAAVSVNGVGIRVANNLIHDAPHIAIWFAGNDHLIERNEIHDVCQEANDAGAIYAGRDWTMRGTQIRDNFIHDVLGFEGRGCNGVYLDDMFSGTEITGNLFYRVKLAMFIGGGRDNLVDNNVFVECDKAIHIDARGINWASYSLDEMRRLLERVPYRSRAWSTRYPELRGILADTPGMPKGNTVRRNIVWKGTAMDVEPAAQPWTRVEDNLFDADPRFIDPSRLDFNLRPDSPARRLGIAPIIRSRIGRHARY